LIIGFNINQLKMLHRSDRTVLAQPGGPMPQLGEAPAIQPFSSGFRAGVFRGAQVSSGYERQND
jgi:hypothetical protein